MFHLSYDSPYEGEVKTLRFRRSHDPKMHGVGFYTDVDGNKWDVHGVFGTEEGCFVQARPCYDSDPRYSTNSFAPRGFVSTIWIPYKVELVDDPSMEMP